MQVLRPALEFIPRSKSRSRSNPAFSLSEPGLSGFTSAHKDLKFIQTAMGHADIQLTLNVYGHLLKDKEAEHA